eukprot:UN10410
MRISIPIIAAPHYFIHFIYSQTSKSRQNWNRWQFSINILTCYLLSKGTKYSYGFLLFVFFHFFSVFTGPTIFIKING